MQNINPFILLMKDPGAGSPLMYVWQETAIGFLPTAFAYLAD